MQVVLIEFQNHQDAWQRVPAILEQSANPNTKIIALNILDACVKTRWRVLAADQREAIKMFLIQLIIKLSSDEDTLKANQAYVKRLNISLVQVSVLNAICLACLRHANVSTHTNRICPHARTSCLSIRTVPSRVFSRVYGLCAFALCICTDFETRLASQLA